MDIWLSSRRKGDKRSLLCATEVSSEIFSAKLQIRGEIILVSMRYVFPHGKWLFNRLSTVTFFRLHIHFVNLHLFNNVIQFILVFV